MKSPLVEDEITVKKEKRSFLPKLRVLSDQLVEIESELSLFWKLNPALFFIIRKGKIMKYNPAVMQEFVCAEAELIGSRLIDIIHPSDSDAMNIILSVTINKLKTQEAILRIGNRSKESWIFSNISLSYVPESDTIFCTAFPLKSKCIGCPYTP